MGDNSKPVTVYAQKASQWWKLWEYKVGLDLNIRNGGFSYGFGVCELTFAVSANETTVELGWGALKSGVTIVEDVNSDDNSGAVYTQYYFRPLQLIAVAVGVLYSPEKLIPKIA